MSDRYDLAPLLDSARTLKIATATLRLKLIHAAAQLESSVLPGEDCEYALEFLRTTFQSLVRQISNNYKQQHLTFTVPTSVDSLIECIHALDIHLNEDATDEKIDTVLAALNAILRLRCASDAVLPALAECYTQARHIIECIEVEPATCQKEIDEIHKLEHPLTALLRLVRDSNELSDELTMELLESVSVHYGKVLAFAAARGRLSVEPEKNKPNIKDDPGQQLASETSAFVQTNVPAPADDQEPDSGIAGPESNEGAPASVEVDVDGKGGQTKNSFKPITQEESAAGTAGVASPELIETTEGSDTTAITVGSARPLVSKQLPTPTQEKPPHEFEVRSSGEIARAIRNGSIERDDGLVELAWALLREHRYGLAYHLASCCELAETLVPIPPSFMIRAVAFGSHVSNPAGLIAQQLKSDFIAAQSLYSDEPDWNNIIALLSIAASSRAALVAPDSHAANLLRSARLQDGLTAVYELCQHLCDFAEHYVPLDPAALRYLTNESTWDEDMKRVKREAEAWWVAAPQVNINFGPARRVWQAWLEKGGIISTLIMPIR